LSWQGDARRGAASPAGAPAGIAQPFRIPGYVPDLGPVLADADLVLMPSKNEGVPLVVLEAFASAKPVVRIRCWCAQRGGRAGSGILIAPSHGEVQAFAEAIDLLLSQPFLRERMGLAGPGRSRRSTICGRPGRPTETCLHEWGCLGPAPGQSEARVPLTVPGPPEPHFVRIMMGRTPGL